MFLLLFLLISPEQTVLSQEKSAEKQTQEFACGDVPFGVGERLRYHMDFSLVRAGYSDMSLIGIDSSFGQPSYVFRSRVRSTSTIDLFYKVRDQVHSYFDMEKLYSQRYERRIREGNFRSQKFFDYNHETGWASISNENGPKGLTPFKPFSHNVISSLYWIRTQDFEKGEDIYLDLHDQDVQYPLKVVVYGKETVEVPSGTFECWKVEPVITSEGLFNKTGRLWVWISDDENRLPVQMKSEIPVGSIMGRLAEYRLGVPYEPGMKIPEIDDSGDTPWDWK
ncbi:DUF3108 domain-containing protein [bacterium]|nr:DUF3108 domain-containing protein [bacterium]